MTKQGVPHQYDGAGPLISQFDQHRADWKTLAPPGIKAGWHTDSPQTFLRYRVRTRYTLARPTPSFFAIAVALRPPCADAGSRWVLYPACGPCRRPEPW